VLTGLFLQFSALHFLLYQPRLEGSRKEKEKETKEEKQLPSPRTDGWASGCVTLCLVVMHYKKLI
jgi:hypothetical protein